MMFSFGCAWMHYMEKYFVGSNQTIFPHYPDSKIYCFFALNVVPEEKKKRRHFFPIIHHPIVIFLVRLDFSRTKQMQIKNDCNYNQFTCSHVQR